MVALVAAIQSIPTFFRKRPEMRLWLFLHFFGQVLWLGAGLGSMVYGIVGKRESGAALAAIVRGQAAIHKLLIGPGAFLMILSGVILSLRLYGSAMSGMAPSVWMLVMQGAGLLGALIVLALGLPTISRLSRVSPEGPTAPLYLAIRRRHVAISMVSGSLGLLALLAASFPLR
jgi:hypothetical protein